MTSGSGSVGSFSVSGAVVTVNLTGVTNAQRITVTLGNVDDGTNVGDVAVPMGVLAGDVNGNAVTNAADVGLTKSQSGQAVTGSNFREDVNFDGSISASDIGLVKSNSGTRCRRESSNPHLHRARSETCNGYRQALLHFHPGPKKELNASDAESLSEISLYSTPKANTKKMKTYIPYSSQSRPAPGGFAFSALAKNMLFLSARLSWKALVALALTVAVCDIKGQSAGTAANEPTVPEAWAAGPDLPSVGVRLAGVYFPANGKFYAMGGRSSDTAGNEFTHPFEYDPNSNSWTTKAATYPDNLVNNMACGVLTDAGTPYIYCAGGSVVVTPTVTTGRVFRYNPVTDTISPVAAPWPAAGTTVLPGGFTVFQNKLYILGGFDTVTGGGQGINQIWEFTPSPAAWVQKPTVLPVPLGYIPTTTIGSLIYTGGGSDITAGLLTDTTNSFVYNPVANTIGTIAPIPRATGETRALNFNGKMLVMGGGRTAPNPSNEVDIYDPATNAWTVNTPIPAFVTARRNFPTDTNGTNSIWLAGGYGSCHSGSLDGNFHRRCAGAEQRGLS